jgi:hypothetical protein
MTDIFRPVSLSCGVIPKDRYHEDSVNAKGYGLVLRDAKTHSPDAETVANAEKRL